MISVNSIEDFSVDFSDSNLILTGKAYPKGTFAVNMLNRDKEKNTALLTEALPLYEVLQERIGGFFSPELFGKAKNATRKVAEMLYEDEPFSLLDVKAEKAKLDLLFSDEMRDFLCLYDEGLTEYRKAQSEPDFPRKVTYRTAAETENERTVTYFPEDVREKKNTEEYGQPITGGTIIGTPTDGGWEWAVTCPAELDTCKSMIYANAVIEYLAKCAEKGILIPSGCVWFRGKK